MIAIHVACVICILFLISAEPVIPTHRTQFKNHCFAGFKTFKVFPPSSNDFILIHENVQFSFIFGEQRYKIMITKNANLLFATGSMRSPNNASFRILEEVSDTRSFVA